MKQLPIPAGVSRDEAYAPVLRLLRDTLLPPRALVERWGMTASHLSNLRRAGRGLPFVRLPTGAKGHGAIRYRLSDLIAAEIARTCDPITLGRVQLAVCAADFLTPAQRGAMEEHLRKALG